MWEASGSGLGGQSRYRSYDVGVVAFYNSSQEDQLLRVDIKVICDAIHLPSLGSCLFHEALEHDEDGGIQWQATCFFKNR